MQLAQPPHDGRFRRQLLEALKEKLGFILLALCIPAFVGVLVSCIVLFAKPAEMQGGLSLALLVTSLVGVFLVPVLMTIFEGVWKATAFTRHLSFQGTRKSLLRITLLSRVCIGVPLWLSIVGAAAALPSLAVTIVDDPDFDAIRSYVLTTERAVLYLLLLFLLLTLGGLCGNWFHTHRKSMNALWFLFLLFQVGTMYKIPTADGGQVSLLLSFGTAAGALPKPALLPVLALLLAAALAAEIFTQRRMNMSS